MLLPLFWFDPVAKPPIGGFDWISVTQTVSAGALIIIAGALIKMVPRAIHWFRNSDTRFRDLEYARYRHGHGLRRVEDHLENTVPGFRRWYDPEGPPDGTTFNPSRTKPKDRDEDAKR